MLDKPSSGQILNYTNIELDKLRIGQTLYRIIFELYPLWLQLSYDGFGYGPAKHELDRVLPQGETVLYLSGPPIVIPDSVDDKYCGPAYLIYSATTGV